MLIRCWGSRGSLPVSSPDCMKFGGDTSCLEIRDDDNRVIIVDAGTGVRRLGQQVAEDNISDIHWFFSHTHLDHIIGFPFFAPLYDPSSKLTIYGHHHPRAHMLELLEKAIRPPYFPIHIRDCKAEVISIEPKNNPLTIGSITIDSIPLSHTGHGLGFKFSSKQGSFVFITDNELGYRHQDGRSYDEYVDFCMGADLLIHDAEYTSEEYATYQGHGHSTLGQAVQLALDAGAKRLGLFHHNCNRTDQEIEGFERDIREYVHHHKADLECFAVSQYMSIDL